MIIRWDVLSSAVLVVYHVTATWPKQPTTEVTGLQALTVQTSKWAQMPAAVGPLICPCFCPLEIDANGSSITSWSLNKAVPLYKSKCSTNTWFPSSETQQWPDSFQQCKSFHVRKYSSPPLTFVFLNSLTVLGRILHIHGKHSFWMFGMGWNIGLRCSHFCVSNGLFSALISPG